MATFCLTKQAKERFKQALKSGEFTPEKYADLESSDARRAFLSKFVGEENAKQVNAIFETKLALKNQKMGMITAAKQLLGAKTPAGRDLISKVERLDKFLDTSSEKAFLEDAADKKLGIGITIDEAERISSIYKSISEEGKKKDMFGLPSKEYMIKTKELADYLKEITPTISNNTAMSVASEVAGVSRTLMTILDFSASFRQGVFLAARHPVIFGKAFMNQFLPAFSEKAFNNVQTSIETDPYYSLVKDAKLSLTDLGSDLSKREEAFIGTWLEKIPVIGQIPRGSARAYTAFLNKLRFDTFKSMVKETQRMGRNPVNDKELLQNIADFVNTATGRGNLGRLEPAANTLSKALFSPRLMASRLNLLNPLYYAKLDPYVRKEAIKSLMAFTTVGMTILAFAKLNGAELEEDPRSADFGKMKIGRTRIDIWGGFQQYIRLGWQFATNQKKSTTTGEIVDLGKGYKATGRYGTLTKFLEGKSSPVVSYILGWMKNENFEGEDFDVKKEALERMVPIMVGDIYDLYRNDDLDSLKYQGLALFGIGVQTYDKKPRETSWKNSESKELMQFKKKVGDEKFGQANEQYNLEYAAWYTSRSGTPEYDALDQESKDSLISSAKEKIKKRVFKDYGFTYKQEKKSKQEKDRLKKLLP